MAAAGDIVWISIPFTLGVALIQLTSISGLCASPQAGTFVLSILAAASLATVIAMAVSCKRARLLSCILFFVLGALCGAGAALGKGGMSLHMPMAGSAALRMKAAIQALPLEERCRAMLTALLLGDRGGLESEVVQSFRDAGGSHILALSGMHLGIIYSCICLPFSILGNSRAAWGARAAVSITLCLFYAVMTGAGPSITRAFLFICIREASRLSDGRSYSAGTCLQTALLVQLYLQPEVIRSAAFQMSYLAMCGVIWIHPRLKGFWQGRRTLMFKIWEAASMAISCQLCTAPLAWIRFHSLPRHFLLTNLLCLPLAWGGIVSGLLCLVLPGECCPPQLFKACTWCLGAMADAMEIISGM